MADRPTPQPGGVQCCFTGVSGTIVDTAEDPKYSSVKAAIDVTTLVTGDLTNRGQTLDVTYNGIGTDPLGRSAAGFVVETELNRKDFNLNWNRGGGSQRGAGDGRQRRRT